MCHAVGKRRSPYRWEKHVKPLPMPAFGVPYNGRKCPQCEKYYSRSYFFHHELCPRCRPRPPDPTPSYMSKTESRRWTTRRAQYFRTHARACSICKATTKIDLHHLRYSTFGEEPDQDLIPLCHDHHDEVHRFAKKNKVNVYTATNTVLFQYGVLQNT